MKLVKLPGPHDTDDIFKVMGSKVKVTDKLTTFSHFSDGDVLTGIKLGDLERPNDSRRAPSLRRLSFLFAINMHRSTATTLIGQTVNRHVGYVHSTSVIMHRQNGQMIVTCIHSTAQRTVHLSATRTGTFLNRHLRTSSFSMVAHSGHRNLQYETHFPLRNPVWVYGYVENIVEFRFS